MRQVALLAFPGGCWIQYPIVRVGVAALLGSLLSILLAEGAA